MYGRSRDEEEKKRHTKNPAITIGRSHHQLPEPGIKCATQSRGTASSNAVLETKKISPQKKAQKMISSFFAIDYCLIYIRRKEGKVSVIRRRVGCTFLLLVCSAVF